MAADALAPYVARTSAAMILTQIASKSIDIPSSLHHRLWIRLFSTTSQVTPLLTPFPSSPVRHWSTRLTSGIRALALPTLQHWTLRYRKMLYQQTSWWMTSGFRTVDISSSHHWCWPVWRSGTWKPPSRVSENPSSSCGPFVHSSDRETAWNSTTHVIMSGRSEEDYIVVLRHLQRLVPSPPPLTTAVLDFKLAVRSTMKTLSWSVIAWMWLPLITVLVEARHEPGTGTVIHGVSPQPQVNLPSICTAVPACSCHHPDFRCHLWPPWYCWWTAPPPPVHHKYLDNIKCLDACILICVQQSDQN